MTKSSDNSMKKHFKQGQFLFREGDDSSCLYLIKNGVVSIRKMRGPAYVEIARIYSNEVLGELSFFDRQPRSATAVALTAVEALEIKFDHLDNVYASVPKYMKSIITSLADRLRKANDMIRRLQKHALDQGIKPEPIVDEKSAGSGAVAKQAEPIENIEIPNDIPATNPPGESDALVETSEPEGADTKKSED